MQYRPVRAGGARSRACATGAPAWAQVRQVNLVVDVYDVRQRVVRAQTRGAAKANAIASAPALLAALPLRGVLVTGDTMDAQRQRSVRIVEAGGDSCWMVKEHQRRLYHDLRLLVAPQPDELPGTSAIPDDFVSVRTVELAHGRIDERILTTSSMLADDQGWPYPAQAFRIVRTRDTGRRCPRDVRHGITSASSAVCTAPDRLNAVRGHWQIAHRVHDRRDVTLGEDASLARMGQAPRVVATLNTMVCSLTARAGATLLARSARRGRAQPHCACRSNTPGGTATLTCRRGRPLALPALALYQPCRTSLHA